MSIEYNPATKRFTFRFKKTINGKVYRKSKQLQRGFTKAQAEAFDVKETARIYSALKEPSKNRVLISDCVIDYMTHHLPECKDGYGIAKELDRVRPFYEGRYVDEIATVGAEYRAAQKGLLAAGTVKNKLSYLRAACRWVQEESPRITIDPSLKMSISMPKVKNERHFYLTREQVVKVCRYFSKDPKKRHAARVGRAVVRVAFYTGMRIGEVLLACENVESMKEILAFMLKDSKNDDRRLTPMHRKLLVLRRYFPLPFKKRWLQALIRRAMTAAGFPEYHLHDVRHSTASALLKGGADLYTVGQVLGHKSLQSTARYSHIDVEMKKAAIDLIR